MSTPIYKFAESLCRDIDIDDTVFVAFAKSLKGVLWTGDKTLIKGLIRKNFKNIINTTDLYKDFLIKKNK